MTTVAVGLIERGGKLLICQRRADQPHAGKWEFPGGKVEAGEAPPVALARELREELGIEATDATELARYDYAYPGKQPLSLVFFRVGSFRGEPDGSQFAALLWERPAALPAYDFLAGDEEIVRELAAGRYGSCLGPAPAGTVGA